MMKLRTKYILFVVIIHLVTLVLTFFIFRDNKIFFIASEVLIIFSIFLSWGLYNQLIHPLKTLLQGADAIRDRDFNIKFLPTGKYEMDQLINVYNAMMDQLRTERTQQEQQHFFLEKLIYTSPTGIVILDYDQNVQQLNPKALQLLGMEEKDILRKSVHELPGAVLREISKLQSGESKTINLNGAETYKLQKSHFIDRGFARYFIMIEDVTPEILAAEKKAYGKVIRMMAHEVNNTIGPVNSILQSTLQAQQNNATINNALQVAMDRNNSLNIFMRNFADLVRLPVPVKKAIDLHQMIQQLSQLMAVKAGEKKINFQFNLHAYPVLIAADAQQMELVLINIVKNAIEAIEEQGTVSFITRLQPAQLIIRDSGKGITYAAADQLFTPFFSTKPDGQGIGLTLVKEILVEHGFSFSLKTSATGTTDFLINFE
ncbi:MAG TPA: ATP-binding protein [Chitinophagaceae bacterium]|nr:ATP-binding protein [Chitinophagaceae bacterium]